MRSRLPIGGQIQHVTDIRGGHGGESRPRRQDSETGTEREPRNSRKVTVVRKLESPFLSDGGESRGGGEVMGRDGWKGRNAA